MKKIILLGALGDEFGREHIFNVKTPGEAIRAFCSNFPAFEKFVVQSSNQHVGYEVISGNYSLVKDEELFYPLGQATLTIAPRVSGGGPGARIFIGAALIALAFTPVGAVVLTGETTLFGTLFAVGAGLALGGVIQLLSPLPKIGSPYEKSNNKPSYFFNGPINTQAQGEPVPYGYGRLIVGSAIISAGITVEETP